MTGTWVKGWVGTTGADSSMAHWKAQTLSGNRHFDAGSTPGRSTAISRRCGLPASSLPTGMMPTKRWRLLVVAHHNLADLLVAMTLPDRAADLLCHIHDCLLATSQSPPVPLSALREAAVRHARSTRTELLAFLGKHGHHDGIQRSLGQCLCQTGSAHQLH